MSKLFRRQLLLFLGLFSIVPAAHALWSTSGQEEPYIRGGNCDDSLIRQSPEMLRALEAIKARIGRPPTLTSCYRSQARQDSIRRRYCGPRRCPGRVATVSQHTEGVAADIAVPGYRGQALCSFLGSIRDSVMGHGGVGAYGGAVGHLDLRPGNCAWNICGQTLGCSNEYTSPRVERYLESTLIPQSFSDWFFNRGSA